MTDSSLNLLIAKAGKIVGSEYALAKQLGVTHQRITAWKSGDQTCTPADRARIADFAREDAVQELVRATIASATGTKREQLQRAMGKRLQATGEAARSTGVHVISLISGLALTGSWSDIPRCIKRKHSTDFVFVK